MRLEIRGFGRKRWRATRKIGGETVGFILEAL